MSTTVDQLEVGQVEVEAALDQRHELHLPGWELVEIDALGERLAPPEPLAWGGKLMAMGFDVGGPSPREDDDWELERLDDPDEDDPEDEDELVEWITDPDDWDVEELEAVGEDPAVPEPRAWSGELMAMGFDVGGGSTTPTPEPTPEDDDWELERLDGPDEDGEDEPEDALEDED